MSNLFTPTTGALTASAHQAELARGVGIVSRAVASRSTPPVLGNILLASDQGRLRLSATNLELSISCWIKSTLATEGATTIPAKTLVDLVNTLPEDQVLLKLALSKQTVELKCGKINSNMKGIDAGEYPVIPDLDLTKALHVDAAQWQAAISRTIVAVSTDEARPLMTGMLLVIKDGEATLVASDGFRLALETNQGQNAQTITTIIPGRTLAELNRIIDNEQPLYLEVPEGRGQIIFQSGEVSLVSQLIEGVFPEYDNILPKRYTTRLVCQTAELRKALKSTDIFAREVAHTGHFSVTPGVGDQPGLLAITAAAAETGDNMAEVDAVVEGPAIKLALNVKYILDGLAGIDTPTVKLEFNTPASPALLKPVGGKSGYLYCAMPLHIG